MLTVPDLCFVADLADVDRVAQERIDLAARERIATLDPPGAEAVQLGAQAQIIGAAHNRVQAAEVVVEREDRPNGVCLDCVDDETAGFGIWMRIVPERRDATHPEPLLLGRRDLVPDPFGRHLALELGEGQEHVQGQPSHR